jgi:hypothetical protein
MICNVILINDNQFSGIVKRVNGAGETSAYFNQQMEEF